MAHARKLLDESLKSKALKFGSFTLKSGRQSPYFFNLGLLTTGSQLAALAEGYAQLIVDNHLEFDVLFGPAYKGIALAALTAAKLAELDEARYGHVGFAYNRKEKKDHGEGGSLVGAALAGQRVLVIDDVITAGTAITEAFGIIEHEQGTLTGVVLALDRQERTADSKVSAVQGISQRYGVPVHSILSLTSIVEALGNVLTAAELDDIKRYKEAYGVN